MIRSSQGLPLRVYSAISSCVPATSAAIETPNARIRPADVLELAQEEGVLALGEMMDYHGVLEGNEHLRGMLEAGVKAGLSLEGHVPSLTGQALSRYIAHGIRSDHTLMTPAKLREKLRKGLYVMLQEKSLAADVIEEVMSLPDRSRVLLITDDVMPNRLRSGHLSRILETAVSLGWEPVDALASATLRPAMYLGLRHLGAIAPGYLADFMLSREDAAFPPERVYVGGTLVARAGRAVIPARAMTDDERVLTRATFETTSASERFFHVAASEVAKVRARVVRVNDANTFTTLEEREVRLEDGVPLDDDLALGVA
jgi:adenine deaminase